MAMVPKGFPLLLFVFLVVEPSFLFGVAVNDKDVWRSRLEKSTDSTRNLEVRFDGPAAHWTDALPIGNGRLGAMIWGGIANETLNLNGTSCFLHLFAWKRNERCFYFFALLEQGLRE